MLYFRSVSGVELRFVKGAFQTNFFYNSSPKGGYFMNSPVLVEVPKWPGYFSQALIARYKP